MKLWVIRLSGFLQHTTPIILILVFVFIAYQTAAFSKENQKLLSDVNATVKNTERIQQSQRETDLALEKAVTELKADNKRQTLILCTFIIRAGLEMNETEVTQVEEICQQEIERLSQEGQLGAGNNAPASTPSNAAQSSPTPVVPLADNQDDEPVPPSQPGLLENLGRDMRETVDRILRGIL
jgi:cytoskeletal protein RodZ